MGSWRAAWVGKTLVTIQPPATKGLFPTAAAVTKASYDFPAQTGNDFLFVSADYCNLATSFYAVFVKGFPIQRPPCEETTVFGCVYKGTCCLGLTHKHNSLTGVEEIFCF